VTPAEAEDDVFTFVCVTPQTANSQPSIYPSLSANPPVSPSGFEQPDGGSVTASHYLDGVPFYLSSKCSMGSEQFDSSIAKIDSLSECLKLIRWSDVHYDFNVERSALQNVGITDTLRRLHAL
jgi:hypothetical protein